MLRKMVPFLIFLAWVCPEFSAAAQEGVKVVPIGDTLKPEGGGEPTGGRRAPVRRRPRPVVVKAGETFAVEVATVMSSGLTKQGEIIFFRSLEDVGPAKRPVIMRGAVGEGRVVGVDRGNKQSKLVVQLSEIESVGGGDVSVSGTIEVLGEKEAAAVPFGERFNATLEEKVVARRAAKIRHFNNFKYRALAEVSGKGVKTDIKKGKSKGKVQVMIEPPSGLSVEDLDKSYLVLYKVNDFVIPVEVPALPGKPKVGDKNKNGTKDLLFEFDGWTFVKYQPRGENNVSFKGKLNDGTAYEAPTRVTIDY